MNAPALLNSISNRRGAAFPARHESRLPEFTSEDARDLFIKRVDAHASAPNLLLGWPATRAAHPELYLAGFRDPLAHALANRGSQRRRGGYNYFSDAVPRLANRLAAHPKRSFEQAWNELAMLEPALFGLGHTDYQPSEPDILRNTALFGLNPAAASELLLRHCSRIHSESPGLNFEACWEALQSEHPSLFALRNRMTVDPGTFDDEFDRHEGPVRKALKEFFETGIRENIPVFRPQNAFINLMTKVRLEHPDWSLPEVWAEMKRRNLTLVKSFVVSVT